MADFQRKVFRVFSVRRAWLALGAASIVLFGYAWGQGGGAAGATFGGAALPNSSPSVAALAQGPQPTGAAYGLAGVFTAVWGDTVDGVGLPVRYFVRPDGGSAREFVFAPGVEPGEAWLLSGKRIQTTVSETVGNGPLLAAKFELASAAPDDTGRGAPYAVTGHHPWITLLCKFPDVATVPRSKAQTDALLGTNASGLDDYWRKNSYGIFDLQGNAVVGADWTNLPSSRASYASATPGGGIDFQKLVDDCTGLYDSIVNFALYDGVNMAFNSTLDMNGGCNCAWGGGSYLNRDGVVSIRTTWMAVWSDFGVYAHETGHGFGLPHSSGGYGQTYNSRWDQMSSAGGTCEIFDGAAPGWGCRPPFTIGYHKSLLGLFAPAQVFVPALNTSTTINLAALEALPTVSGDYMMARIPALSGSFDYYTLELRTRASYDVNTPAGASGAVLLHTVKLSGRPEPAVVVDPDNDFDPNDCYGAICVNRPNDARWVTGELYSDPANKFSMKVLNVGDSITPATVVIRYGDPVTVPTSLRFDVQPSPSNVTGLAFIQQPAVSVVDSDTFPVTSDNSSVITLSLVEGGATLACSGGNSKTVTAGVATFAGCAVTGPAGAYTLRASRAGLPDVSSSPLHLGSPRDCAAAGCNFTFDDFSAFTATGLWHQESLGIPPGMSGPVAAYNFGCNNPFPSGCTYAVAGPNTGRLVTPYLNTGAASLMTVSLSRSMDYGCFPGGDTSAILYSTDGGASFQPLSWYRNISTGPFGYQVFVPGFTWRGLSLGYPNFICGDSLGAQTLTYVVPAGTTNIAFDAYGDGVGDGGFGWVLDDLTFSAPVPAQVGWERSQYQDWKPGVPLPGYIQPMVSVRTASGALISSDNSTSFTLGLLQDGVPSGPPAAPVLIATSEPPASGPTDVAAPVRSEGALSKTITAAPAMGRPLAAGEPLGALPPGTLTCSGGTTVTAQGGIGLFSGCQVNALGQAYQYYATGAGLPRPVASYNRFNIVTPRECALGQCVFDFESPMFQKRSLWHREGFATIPGLSGTTLAFNKDCAGPGVIGCTYDAGQFGWYGGYAISDLVTITEDVTVSFKVVKDVSSGAGCSTDQLNLYVSPDGGWGAWGVGFTTSSISPGPLYLSGNSICGASTTPQTVSMTIPVGYFLPGGISNIIFYFSANKPNDNNHPGVFIDDVRIVPTRKHLEFNAAPADGFVLVPFSVQPVVAIKDATGAIDTSDSSTVITLTMPPGGLDCAGGNSRTVVSGVATFSGCYTGTGGTRPIHADGGASIAAGDSAPVAVQGLGRHQLSAIAVGSEGIVFGRSPANQLWYRETLAGVFGSWTIVDTGGTVASRPEAVAAPNGDLYVFFRGTADDLRYVKRTAGVWSAVVSLGGVIARDPVAAVDSTGDIVVLSATATGQLYYQVLPNGGAFGGWIGLSGALSSELSLTAYGGDIYLFGLNSGGLLWSRKWSGASNTWNAWVSLDGVLSGAPAAVVHSADLYVFAVNPGGFLWSRALSGGSWGPWTPLDGVLSDSPDGASFGGVLVVAGASPGGTLWERGRTGAWAGWVSLGGGLGAGPALASVSDGIYAFAVSPGGNLWFRKWNGAIWGSWTNLGGVLAVHPP